VIWHADEIFIHALKRMYYLWNVIDNNSTCITIHLGRTRGMEDAVRTFVKSRQYGIPDIIVTDEWNCYPRAIRKVFSVHGHCPVRHVQAHFKPVLVRHSNQLLLLTNNRIEGFNSWLRNHYSCLRGFKSERHMEMFLEGFKRVWNSNKFFVLSLIKLAEPKIVIFKYSYFLNICVIHMGTITISVDDEVEKEFRKIVEEHKGNKKGDLGKSVTEAMKKWTEEKKQKEIAKRQMKRSEKGMYKLPKNWKFNRDEIYDRK